MLDNAKYDLFGEEFLQEYLARGMGTLSKREIDVLVMHLLHKYTDDVELRDNQELSIALQLTQARVKGLRHEARLRYPPDEAAFVPRRFLYTLARAQFEGEDGRLVFVLEDSYVRDAIQGELKKRGSIGDTSFNRELVKVRVDQLEPVLESFYGKGICKSFIKDMQKAVASGGKIKFSDVKKSFVLKAAKALGAATVEAVAALMAAV